MFIKVTYRKHELVVDTYLNKDHSLKYKGGNGAYEGIYESEEFYFYEYGYDDFSPIIHKWKKFIDEKLDNR